MLEQSKPRLGENVKAAELPTLDLQITTIERNAHGFRNAGASRIWMGNYELRGSIARR